jgi:hypothetical protein
MSLIPDYANAVGSAMSYNRKAADTKGKEKTDGNASSEKTGKANKADKTDRTGKTGTVTGRTIGNPKLSEKAAKYYEELKRKYSNMDFILVSEDQKEKARAQAGSYANASKMVVLIDEDKIERMAEDENYRRQYEAIIANAGSGIAQMKSSLEASGTKVKGYGMQVNDGGTATYFAVLQKSSDAQKERIEKKREKAAEEKKTEARRAQKDAQEKRIRDGKNQRDEHAAERVNKTDETAEADWENTVTITASSIGELLKKISDYQQNERMNTVQTKEERLVGGHIDYKG